MRVEDIECSGNGRCHGCLRWCVDCGDVEFTCDDPECEEHPRLSDHEREQEDIEFRVNNLKKKIDELIVCLNKTKYEIMRYKGSDLKMCPRGNRMDVIRKVMLT